MANEAYSGWAIVELMGHHRTGGQVREVQQYGVRMLAIDIPGEEPGSVKMTQYYGGSSIYCLTPVTEEAARRAAGIYPKREPVALGLPTFADEVSPTIAEEILSDEPTDGRYDDVGDEGDEDKFEREIREDFIERAPI